MTSQLSSRGEKPSTMTTFILHGGFTREKNDLNAGFYREMSKYVPSGATILLVYFAREDNEDRVEELFEGDKNKILEQAGNKKLNFTLASRDVFIEQVKAADVIYMRGGSTQKLLDALKQYPRFKDAIRGKVVAGSSAGAYVLSTYYYSGTQGGVHEGLGILPIRIICHYESNEMKREGDQKGITALEKYPKDLELIILKDYEWKTITLDK